MNTTKWRVYLQNIGSIDSETWRIVCAMIPDYCNTTGNDTHFNIWGFKKLREAQLFARSFNELTNRYNCHAARIFNELTNVEISHGRFYYVQHRSNL